jgi:adenosine/AMP kinase
MVHGFDTAGMNPVALIIAQQTTRRAIIGAGADDRVLRRARRLRRRTL